MGGRGFASAAQGLIRLGTLAITSANGWAPRPSQATLVKSNATTIPNDGKTMRRIFMTDSFQPYWRGGGQVITPVSENRSIFSQTTNEMNRG
jgi:hypothetical protein